MNILSGKEVSQAIKEELKVEAQRLNSLNLEHKVGLAVILVGENPASQVYVRNKINACAEVGINSFFEKMSENATQEEVLNKIIELNNNDDVSGIILQLPLPKGLDENPLLDAIKPEKDVDGCHYVSKGKLWTGRDSLIACTPYGVMKILDYYKIPLEGKNAVVIGRSNLVGKPMSQLLLDRNCTVTICHSRTKNLSFFTKNADIIIVAIGKAKFLKGDMIEDGAIVIDVGINRNEEGKLCGDVDFDSVKDKCSYITPVPGGVGPMTVTMLISNTITAYKMVNGIK